MKKIICALMVLGVCFCGCSIGKRQVEFMLDNPPKLLRDPHYENYKEHVDDLEGRYLRKEISYAQYTERRQVLEDRYTQEVDKRTAIVEGQ